MAHTATEVAQVLFNNTPSVSDGKLVMSPRNEQKTVWDVTHVPENESVVEKMTMGALRKGMMTISMSEGIHIFTLDIYCGKTSVCFHEGRWKKVEFAPEPERFLNADDMARVQEEMPNLRPFSVRQGPSDRTKILTGVDVQSRSVREVLMTFSKDRTRVEDVRDITPEPVEGMEP